MMASSSAQIPRSLPELHASVDPARAGGWRRHLAFFGPAFLISVGYMDPGNWATDLEAGSRFGTALVWVLLMSNAMAVLLQTLSARLGIVAGRDLAQACRSEYPRAVAIPLWILCEAAIIACDLAEVLGTIIGLQLLFGLPLLWGCVITLLDTFLLLAIQRLGIRRMEAFILVMVATIGMAFLAQTFIVKPSFPDFVAGFLPQVPEGSLLIILGLIGATVMPHNLYLHSALVQTRRVAPGDAGKAAACRHNLVDTVVALNAAFLINAAILVLAATVFFRHGVVVTEIQQAHHLLAELVGSRPAQVLFALALLAAGQSSTLTGTLAGQIVMEGFVSLRLQPWLRRLVTRSAALVPAVLVIGLTGEAGTYQLMIASQVVLSLQLPFAILPLVHFTGSRAKMGAFVNAAWVKALAWVTAAVVVGLNARLVWDVTTAWLLGNVHPALAWGAALAAAAVAGLLVVVALWPLRGKDVAWRVPMSFATAPPETFVPSGGDDGLPWVAAALDRSGADAAVVAHCRELATQGKRLLLLHVTDTAQAQVYGGESWDGHAMDDVAYLEETCAQLTLAGARMEWRILHGRPADQLVAFARSHPLELLIMGSHGHGLAGFLAHGKTAAHVRKRVKAEVKVVR
jgi:manganese transport protein